MKLLITGGGTGGHLAIARAIKNSAIARNWSVTFIGSTNGQDKKWFENDSDWDEKYFLESSGVINKKGFSKIFSLLNLVKLAFNAKKIFKKHNFDAVISVGGYSSASASFTAILTRTPLFIHEQNYQIGKLNSILKPFAKEFYSSYLSSSPVRDYPINDIMFKTAKTRKKIKTVIFLGGSQGATAINDFAIKVALELTRRGIDIIHQTGKEDYERIKETYEYLQITPILFDFSTEIHKYISRADLAIARSGASSVWEFTANGLPAFFIPYPYANDHQKYNAKQLYEQKLCWIKLQKNVLPEDLYLMLNTNLTPISEQLKTLIQPNGADAILDDIKRKIWK
jgi:UDP-N-acetylglucosamine--N-acetylmuramyl-(pentapeptide) pyrophosphoryl-undecaprenol N-acetylglucosamine transferase